LPDPVRWRVALDFLLGSLWRGLSQRKAIDCHWNQNTIGFGIAINDAL